MVRSRRACVRTACNVSATLLYPPTWPADPLHAGAARRTRPWRALRHLRMTYRQRKARRRRGRGSGSRVVALSAGRAGHGAGDRRAVRGGVRGRRGGHGSRTVRAEGGGQGRELGDLRRRRLAPGLRAIRRDPHPRVVGGDAAGGAPGRRGHRGRALLRARGRGLLGHHPRRGEEPRVRQERAGRIHDHPAAGARPVHQGPRAQRASARSARPSWPPSSSRSARRSGSSRTTSTTCRSAPSTAERRSASRAPPRRSSTSTPRTCTLPEAATLAGLPQAPSQYNPFRNPQAALTRRNEVLDKMAENGFITRARAITASSQDLGLRKGTRYTTRREPYFFDYVQEQLIERYGVGVYRRGGLKVHTTIDPKTQDARAGRDQLLLRRPRRAQLGDRVDRPHQRQDQGDGLQRHLQGPPLQHRRPGPAPAGLRLQDDGAHRRGAPGNRSRLAPTTRPGRWRSTIPSTGSGP